MGKKFIAKCYFLLANNFTLPADNFTFLADNFTFPVDISFLRILKSEGIISPGNLNPWQNLQVNPQEKLKVLVMAGLATKKVGAEPGLVPRLAGGGSGLACEGEKNKRRGG